MTNQSTITGTERLTPRKKQIPWKKNEVAFLIENMDKMTIPDIAKQIGRTEVGVNIKLHRMRAGIKKGGILKENVSRNLLIEMLKQRIGDPDNFKPQRKFFQKVGIKQKRFWQLYRGEKNITNSEYRTLAHEWNISLDDLFELRQMELNFD